MPKSKEAAEYDEDEAQKRFEAALRGGLTTPPTPLKEKPKKPKNREKPPAKAASK